MKRAARLHRAKAVFSEVIDLDSDKRSSLLDLRCGTDDELRRLVESLIAADEEPGDGLPLPDPRPFRSGDAGAGESAGPERLGHYRVTGILGQGGMGVVYSAEDGRLGRTIAIKRVPERIAGDANALAEIQREARLLAALNHPNISTIYALEEIDGHPFFTLELIPGDTLADRIDAGAVSVRDALVVGQQVAAALEYAHGRGVVHRDLKPANIKVTPEGRVKVLDFGIAEALVDKGAPEATLDGTRGTPGYMSPEQLRGDTADESNDLWALGCILYSCLTGESPFPGSSVDERIHATLHAEPDWQALPKETPEAIRDLLVRCLSRERSDRVDATGILAVLSEATGGSADRTREAIRGGADPSSVSVPNNLPATPSRFVGRSRVLPELKRTLSRERLLTLVGSGGAGKTRLAIEIGRRSLSEFVDGVWFVQLATVTAPEMVSQTVADAVGLLPEPRRSAEEILASHFETKTSLLILDNCEHLLDACASLTEQLLSSCIDVRVLATSRQGLPGGRAVSFALPSMELPPPDLESLQDLSHFESVRLFLDRAEVARPGLTLGDTDGHWVNEICRQLDGIPLAIELAAARMKVLGVEEVAERLRDRFRLLSRGSDPDLRHQSLRAAIDWSRDLLSEAEQTLFRRLSVFSGGWTAGSAEAICSGGVVDELDVLDLLSDLADKSLIEAIDQGENEPAARHRMLETVRQYAREQLDSNGEIETATVRHRNYFLDLVETAESHLIGPEQSLWGRRIEADLENVRAAIQISLDSAEDPDVALRFVVAFSRQWLRQGRWKELRNFAERALALEGASPETKLHAAARASLGHTSFRLFELNDAREAFEDSLAVQERLGNQEEVAGLHGSLGLVRATLGDIDAARRDYETCLEMSQKLDYKFGIAVALRGLGTLAFRDGKIEEAELLHAESLAACRESGNREGIAVALRNLGDAVRNQWQLERAREYYGESVEIARELGFDEYVAGGLYSLASCVQPNDPEEAERLYTESLSILARFGHRYGVAQALEGLGSACVESDQHDRAIRMISAAEVIREKIGAPPSPTWVKELEIVRERVRETLGPEKLEAAVHSGRQMSFEQAIAFGLSKP